MSMASETSFSVIAEIVGTLPENFSIAAAAGYSDEGDGFRADLRTLMTDGQNPFKTIREYFRHSVEIVADWLEKSESDYEEIENGTLFMDDFEVIQFCEFYKITPLDLIPYDVRNIPVPVFDALSAIIAGDYPQFYFEGEETPEGDEAEPVMIRSTRWDMIELLARDIRNVEKNMRDERYKLWRQTNSFQNVGMRYDAVIDLIDQLLKKGAMFANNQPESNDNVTQYVDGFRDSLEEAVSGSKKKLADSGRKLEEQNQAIEDFGRRLFGGLWPGQLERIRKAHKDYSTTTFRMMFERGGDFYNVVSLLWLSRSPSDTIHSKDTRHHVWELSAALHRALHEAAVLEKNRPESEKAHRAKEDMVVGFSNWLADRGDILNNWKKRMNFMDRVLPMLEGAELRQAKRLSNTHTQGATSAWGVFRSFEF